MTTTLHVRLPIVVANENAAWCSDVCPCRLDSEDGYICGAFGDELSHVDDEDGDSPSLRSADCLAATAADELRERVVLAARESRRDAVFPDEDAEDALTEAVDALDAATKVHT